MPKYSYIKKLKKKKIPTLGFLGYELNILKIWETVTNSIKKDKFNCKRS